MSQIFPVHATTADGMANMEQVESAVWLLLLELKHYYIMNSTNIKVLNLNKYETAFIKCWVITFKYVHITHKMLSLSR